MPHVREVPVTAHDRHDPMLVAALAADDLAGTDRDQVLALTTSCADCSILLADLRAIARATADLPPPVRSAHRDFRLSPRQAADLRPHGLRGWIGAGSTPRLASRPLGVALATFGLMGLLIGNLPLGFSGGSAASSSAGGGGAGAAAAPNAADNGGGAVTGAAEGQGAQPVPAASSGSVSRAPAAGYGAGSAAASVRADTVASPSGAKGIGDSAGTPAERPSDAAAIAGGGQGSPPAAVAGAGPATQTGTASPLTPWNIVFVIAVIAGLALLVGSRRRTRAPI